MLKKITLSLCFAIVGSVGGIQLANADDPTSWYRIRWRNLDEAKFWAFTAEFPTGSGQRTRVRDGLDAWMQLGRKLTFREVSERSNFSVFPLRCTSPYRANSVHYEGIDGRNGILAFIFPCRYAGTSELAQFQYAWDEAEDWYWGTGDAPDGTIVGGSCFVGPCKIDGWSVASHEWGHAVGFLGGPENEGHWPGDSTKCPGDSNEHTMCPEYYLGTERNRSLEEHDKHTYSNAYPPK